MLKLAAMHLPPPEVKQMTERDVLSELKAKLLALDQRKNEVASSQRDPERIQDSIKRKGRPVSCLDQDILGLKRSLLVEAAPRCVAEEQGEGLFMSMPEAKHIRESLESMVEVLRSTQTLNSAYAAYAESEANDGRQPLGRPTGWPRKWHKRWPAPPARWRASCRSRRSWTFLAAGRARLPGPARARWPLPRLEPTQYIYIYKQLLVE